MVVYFSGTGNSKYCAELIAEALDDQIINSFGFIRNGIAAELITAKPWVFVAPTFAWQLPRIFADFIRSGSFEGDKRAYFVMTCGSGIGGAGAKCAELCGEVGLEYMGVIPVVMPENYVAMFPVPEQEKAERIVAEAGRKLTRQLGPIVRGEKLPKHGDGAMGKLLSGFINWGFYNYSIGDKKFFTTDNCIACGKCTELCPLGNIRIEEGKIIWGGNCTHCMACICRCPTGAIEYGKISKGKNRYVCPEYKK